jgi:hypothetical protein
MSNNIILTPDERAGLMMSLSPEYQNLSDNELYGLVSNRLKGMGLTPDQAEGFWGSLWNGIKDVGSKALQIVPSIAQGAASGGVFGLPGAIVGGLAGGLSGLLSGQPQPPAPPVPAALSQIPTGQAGKLPASAQLLQLIQNPALLQTLVSLAMGPPGRKSMPVGATPVATGDFLNALKVLAASASEELAETYATNPEDVYILSSPSKLDPANTQDRAKALMELLQEQNGLRRGSDLGRESLSRLGESRGPLVVELE